MTVHLNASPHVSTCFLVFLFVAAYVAVLSPYRLSETIPKINQATCSVAWTPIPDFETCSTISACVYALFRNSLDAVCAAVLSLYRLSKTNPKMYRVTRSIVWTSTPDFITH